MANLLQEHLVKRLGNNTENLDTVLDHFTFMQVKRNELLLQQGQICRQVYFVAAGCLQVFLNEDGNENTRDLVLENNWCSELISFGQQKPATENIRAIEPSDLYCINYSSFQNLLRTVPQFDKVYRQILEQSYANSVYRINTFVSLSALDRIKWLMHHRPELMTRMSSKLIASYLGINKDVFSRLKANL